MSADDGPRPPDDGRSLDDDGRLPQPVRRVWTATDGPLLVVRETALSVGSVLAVGLLLFAVSGIWPPMVAVESGSMEPHMHKGDLVFITDLDRFAPDAAHEGTAVVPRDRAVETGYWKFGDYGSVIVYDSPNRAGPPVIHRARFWVEAGENWYDRANPDYANAGSCEAMPNCPAPHAGFITKGDHNGGYDQVNGLSRPVKPGWIVGVARVRIPYLGWVRLGVSDLGVVGADGDDAGAASVDASADDGRVANPAATAGDVRVPNAASMDPNRSADALESVRVDATPRDVGPVAG